MRRRPARVVTTITDAEPSQEDQLRVRERRYLLMMALRVFCLVLAAVLVSAQVPLLWLWLVLCAAGMVFLPWIAVVLANDRLPKDRHRFRRHRPVEPTARAVGAPAGSPDPRSAELPADAGHR